MPFGVVSPTDMSENAKNAELAVKLWETSERVVTEVLAK